MSTSAQLTESDFRRGYFGVAMSLVLFSASRETENLSHVGLQIFFVIAAFAFSLVGCAVYARAKGLSRGHVFCGLMPLFGFWYLLCLEDRASRGGKLPEDSERSS